MIATACQTLLSKLLIRNGKFAEENPMMEFGLVDNDDYGYRSRIGVVIGLREG